MYLSWACARRGWDAVARLRGSDAASHGTTVRRLARIAALLPTRVGRAIPPPARPGEDPSASGGRMEPD